MHILTSWDIFTKMWLLILVRKVFSVHSKIDALTSPKLFSELFLSIRNVKIKFFYTRLSLLLKDIIPCEHVIELRARISKIPSYLVKTNSLYHAKFCKTSLPMALFLEKGIGMKLITSISLFLVPFWSGRSWIFQPSYLDIWKLSTPWDTSRLYLMVCLLPKILNALTYL